MKTNGKPYWTLASSPPKGFSVPAITHCSVSLLVLVGSVVIILQREGNQASLLVKIVASENALQVDRLL